jgi:hypothetical protein
MRTNDFKTTLRAAVLGIGIFLLAVGISFGQQQINLTAGPSTATLPDGSRVPMWGYSCDATQVLGTLATCAKLNPAATGWSPVIITVPTGQDLQINLTNNLTFPAGTGTNNIPTSLMIVGQLGGGLGTSATTVPSPVHNNSNQVSPTNPSQVATWPIAGDANGPLNNPPPQPNRVQSFSTEVEAGTGTATTLTWTVRNPGGYRCALRIDCRMRLPRCYSRDLHRALQCRNPPGVQ